MPTDFYIKPLPVEKFLRYFSLDDKTLARYNAKWVTADADIGYPCRVSLRDANVGERVLLLPYRHLDVDSPYRASGPIFVREDAVASEPDKNEIPDMLKQRLQSVRAYDSAHMMVAARVVDSLELAPFLRDQLSNGEVDYLQIHNANPGCFNCSVIRA